MSAGAAPRLAPGARLGIETIGAVARRGLVDGRRGRVAALFERSFYLELSGALICVGRSELGAGPLNALVVGGARDRRLPLGLAVGAPVGVAGSVVEIGPAFELAFAQARAWRPAPPPQWSRASLLRGLAALEAWLEGAPPREGLGALAHSRPASLPANPVSRRAVAPLAALNDWLGEAFAPGGAAGPLDPAALAPLVGLGPGLTPSGDDFLGGALIALHLVGRADLARRLAAVALPLIRRDSNQISAAHLAAAGEGLGHVRLHDVLAGLLAGEARELPSALARLAALGHCSGLDGLAGAATVLHRWSSR